MMTDPGKIDVPLGVQTGGLPWKPSHMIRTITGTECVILLV